MFKYRLREKASESPSRFVEIVVETQDTYLAIVDENGEVIPGGYLLGLLADGEIMRCRGVAKSLGLPLNDRGQVCMTEDLR